MRFSHLIFFADMENPSRRVSDADLAILREVVAGLRGINRANLYQPTEAMDLFTDDPGSPSFGLQLYFEELELLEEAAGRQGGLQAIADPGALASLADMDVTQQVMLNRYFAVAEPRSSADRVCSYVVHYPGPAADPNDWLGYYIRHHPPIMRRFPGVREIEISTRVDWIDALPWRRVHHMQRNRGSFDTPSALSAALHSDVRHEMRADFARFPRFDNGSFHYPFETEIIEFSSRRISPAGGPADPG